MSKKTNERAVQFLGFEGREGDDHFEQRFDMDRAQFTAHPAWLDGFLFLCRIEQPRLVFGAGQYSHDVEVELNGWVIDLGKGKFRVVTNSDFQAVRGL